MANDFSGDVNCVALWKFDNDATDSQGGNDLTAVNTPTYSTGVKKEGTHSINFDTDRDQHCTLADASLDADFPGKNSVGETSFSFCFWVYITSLADNGYTIAKRSDTDHGYFIKIDTSGYLELNIGYGTNETTLTFGTAMADGKWYHIGITYDASDNGAKIRIWDDNASDLLDSNETGTIAGDFSPDTAAFYLGYSAHSYVGYIDELVVFKDVLTDDDIDTIRAGTYTLSQSYEESLSSSVGLTSLSLNILEKITSISASLGVIPSETRNINLRTSLITTVGKTSSILKNNSISRKLDSTIGLLTVKNKIFEAYRNLSHKAGLLQDLSSYVHNSESYFEAFSSYIGLSSSKSRSLKIYKSILTTLGILVEKLYTIQIFRDLDSQQGLSSNFTKAYNVLKQFSSSIGLSQFTTKILTYVQSLSSTLGLSTNKSSTFDQKIKHTSIKFVRNTFSIKIIDS